MLGHSGLAELCFSRASSNSAALTFTRPGPTEPRWARSNRAKHQPASFYSTGRASNSHLEAWCLVRVQAHHRVRAAAVAGRPRRVGRVVLLLRRQSGSPTPTEMRPRTCRIWSQFRGSCAPTNSRQSAGDECETAAGDRVEETRTAFGDRSRRGSGQSECQHEVIQPFLHGHVNTRSQSRRAWRAAEDDGQSVPTSPCIRGDALSSAHCPHYCARTDSDEITWQAIQREGIGGGQPQIMYLYQVRSCHPHRPFSVPWTASARARILRFFPRPTARFPIHPLVTREDENTQVHRCSRSPPSLRNRSGPLRHRERPPLEAGPRGICRMRSVARDEANAASSSHGRGFRT